MATLLNIGQAINDMQQELAREQRFSRDAYQVLKKGIALVREAMDALEKDAQDIFEERDRAISRLHGNSDLFVTTIEADDPLGIGDKGGGKSKAKLSKPVEQASEPELPPEPVASAQ